MTLVPGSIQSRRIHISVPAVCPQRELKISFQTRAHHHGTPTVLLLCVLEPPELAVVDFDGLLRTENFLTAARHVVQHDLSTEFGPFTDGCRTEQMLLLDCDKRIAMNNVVRPT